jgi:glutamate-1-semialdehyde 2,1-aminomutase
LEGLRSLCDRFESLLILDEVMTGFRLAYGGAQERLGIRPDLTTLGKVIGGGLPVGAFGGRGDVMERVAPAGDIYQAGTLSGNPLAMAAGIATLDQLADGGVYQLLEERGEQLEKGLARAAAQCGVPVSLQRVGSMMTMFFTPGEVTDFASAKTSDTELFASFFRGMLERGVYLAPSQFEAAFISAAHTPEDIERTSQAAAEVLRELA